MASTIQVRVEDELKEKAEQLFRELGTDTTSAIRMFLTQAVANNGFPFEIKKGKQNPLIVLSEEELLQKLEHSRKAIDNGQYKSAEMLIAEMRTTYDL